MPSSNPRYRDPSARAYCRAVLKRRGDPCYLCGKPIDYSLPAGDPLSFEVDEVIPISKGGDPYDCRPGGNCRSTHRICNQRKGAKLVTELRALDRAVITSQEW